MDLLESVLFVLHIVGLVALLGGLAVQLRAKVKVVNRAVFFGIWTQLVTGLALVGVLDSADAEEVDHVKIGVKLAVAVVIAVIVWINRRRESISNLVYLGLIALTLLNLGIAGLWGAS